MEIKVQSKSLVKLNVKKKAFTNIAFMSNEVIAYDKYRYQCTQSSLQSFYSQTISFAISSNGEYGVVITKKKRLIVINLKENAAISNCLLPENINIILKQYTKYNQITFFTSHLTKHSYLQENNLKSFVDSQGEHIALLASNSLVNE